MKPERMKIVLLAATLASAGAEAQLLREPSRGEASSPAQEPPTMRLPACGAAPRRPTRGSLMAGG